MAAYTYAIAFTISSSIQILLLLWSISTLSGLFSYITRREIHHQARQMLRLIVASQLACLFFSISVATLAFHENPQADQCNVLYKMSAFAYALGTGLFYAYLFRKYLLVNVEHGIMGHWVDQVMKWVLVVGIPALGLMLVILASGVVYPVPESATDGKGSYCAAQMPIYVYIILIVGDFGITALFTALFIRPLRESINAVKPNVLTTELVENVLRNGLYSGIFSVSINFISLFIFCLSDVLHDASYDVIMWQFGPGVTAITNAVVMLYDMRHVWWSDSSRRMSKVSTSPSKPAISASHSQGTKISDNISSET